MKSTPLLLLVALAWASFGFAQSTPQRPSSAQMWQTSQKTDPAGTMTFTRFTLAGKFLSPPHVKAPNRPALTVDCIPANESHHSKGKFLAANLLVGAVLKIVYVEPEEIRGTSYYPKVAVRVRMDDAQDEEGQWSSGTDKISTSIPKDSLKKILRAHTVAITADDPSGAQIAMRFDMPDPTAVEEACNVDE